MKAQELQGRWAVLGAVVLLLGITGCAAPPAPTPAVSATATSAPLRTAVPVAAAPPAVPTATGQIALIWWTPEFLSPAASQPSGQLLAEQLAAFEASQENTVTVDAVLKARYGRGGLLDFLRTAQPVAPSILPDLVTLDVADLEQAAAAGLLRPLDDLLDPELLARLYPFATANGRFNGGLLAVQLAADVEHIVYLGTQTQAPPATWPALLATGLPYLFPVARTTTGSAGRPPEILTHAVISQYLSAGAAQAPAGRGLQVEAQPLARLLSFYEEAAQRGLLPPAALEVGDAETVWSVYTQSTVPFAYINSRSYLAEREARKDIAFAAGPGYVAPARSLADGWAVAIVTGDPARQRAAAELINWLLTPQHAAAWSRSAGWLPTSPEALAAWGADAYISFLDEQLATAIPHPVGSEYAQAAARMQKAVVSVVKGELSSAQAVETALAP